jgi:hypothetical protein
VSGRLREIRKIQGFEVRFVTVYLQGSSNSSVVRFGSMQRFYIVCGDSKGEVRFVIM